MTLRKLLESKSVISHVELSSATPTTRGKNKRTQASLLRYHQRAGHLVRVRRGLYFVVPLGLTPETSPVDIFLLAGKVATDAILAYHTALEFHGRAYSSFKQIYYVSSMQQRPWSFGGYTFHRIAPPVALARKHRIDTGVKLVSHSGEHIRVATLERTLVDVLDRPDLAGGWEELWRSLESVEFFDLDAVVEYAIRLANSTTAAKVGFFLEQHRETLMVQDSHLSALRRRRPVQPHYIARRSQEPSVLIRDWHLLIPRSLLNRTWQEVP